MPGPSIVENICNAWATDLTTNVPGLADAKVHLLVPWDPEEMQASPGERHLSVWPDPTAVESSRPLSSDAHELIQTYVVQVWEDASASQERRAADVAADVEFVRLWESVRSRFYVSDNQFLSGTERTWYQQSAWSTGSGLLRWFALSFQAVLAQGFNASGTGYAQ